MSSASVPATACGCGGWSRVRRAPAMWNLLVKELRESRGIVIAGVAIYWGVPLFLEAVYTAIDRSHEVIGFLSWVLLVVTGWLYAIIAGAHTVCRDWGRSEELFLLAQPVSARQVVWAKFIAGAGVVFGIAAMAALMSLTLVGAFARYNAIGGAEYAVWCLLLACVLVVSYVLAFAAAVMTRQMLASVLVAGLVLLMWVTAPLLSNRLAFLQPDWDVFSDSVNVLPGAAHAGKTAAALAASFVTPFFVCVGVCVALCLVAALRASTAERRIRIGHKPLAWTVAIVAVGLFSMAMSEVGISGKVCDRARLYDSSYGPSWQWYPSLVCEGDVCTAIAGSNPFELRRFRVGADGRVRFVSHQGRVGIDPVQPGNHRGMRAEARFQQLLEVKPDSGGGLLVTCMIEQWAEMPPGVRTIPTSDQDPQSATAVRWWSRFCCLSRQRIRWAESGEPKIEQVGEAGSPGDAVGDPGSERLLDWYRLHNGIWTDKHAYLLYEMPHTSYSDGHLDTRRAIADEVFSRGSKGMEWPGLLQIYDWSGEASAKKVFEAAVPPGWRLGRTSDGLVFREAVVPGLNVGPLPLDDLDAIKRLFANGGFPGNTTPRQIPYSHLKEWGRPVVLGQAVDNNRGLLFESRASGITVARMNKHGVPDIEKLSHSPSLLARAFRGSRGELTLLDTNLLAEAMSGKLWLYDTSDPDRIRRVGFYNLTGRGCAVVKAARGHILVVQDGVLTVLERPRTGRALPETAAAGS